MQYKTPITLSFTINHVRNFSHFVIDFLLINFSIELRVRKTLYYKVKRTFFFLVYLTEGDKEI